MQERRSGSKFLLAQRFTCFGDSVSEDRQLEPKTPQVNGGRRLLQRFPVTHETFWRLDRGRNVTSNFRRGLWLIRSQRRTSAFSALASRDSAPANSGTHSTSRLNSAAR